MARCRRCGSSEWALDSDRVCASCNGANARAMRKVFAVDEIGNLIKLLFKPATITLFVGIGSCSSAFNGGPWWCFPLCVLSFWAFSKVKKD